MHHNLGDNSKCRLLVRKCGGSRIRERGNGGGTTIMYSSSHCWCHRHTNVRYGAMCLQQMEYIHSRRFAADEERPPNERDAEWRDFGVGFEWRKTSSTWFPHSPWDIYGVVFFSLICVCKSLSVTDQTRHSLTIYVHTNTHTWIQWKCEGRRTNTRKWPANVVLRVELSELWVCCCVCASIDSFEESSHIGKGPHGHSIRHVFFKCVPCHNVGYWKRLGWRCAICECITLCAGSLEELSD